MAKVRAPVSAVTGRRGAVSYSGCECRVVVVIAALFGWHAFGTFFGAQRAPVRLGLVAPGREIISRPLARKDVLRLNVDGLGHIAALVTDDA